MGYSTSIPDEANPASRVSFGAVQSTSMLAKDLSARDIICGRGGRTKKHAGNENFRRMCASVRHGYAVVTNNRERQAIVIQIFEELKCEGYRFVREDETKRGSFYQVDDTKEKASLLGKIRQCITDSNKGDPDYSNNSVFEEAETPITESQVPFTLTEPNSNGAQQHIFLPEPANWFVESRIEQVSELPHIEALREVYILGFHDGLASLDSSYQGETLDTHLEVEIRKEKSVSPRTTLCKTSEFQSVDSPKTTAKSKYSVRKKW